MESKFRTGAFVFTRARGLHPRLPEDLLPLAQAHGISKQYIPSYAGDRVAIGRAISQASAGLQREGFLLRPITRTSTQVVFGVVKEDRDEAELKLDHDFEGLVSWSAEPEPSRITGDHPISRRVAEAYESVRGKVVSDDWSGVITAYLESHDAARVRSDGRIFWVPPQRIAEVRHFGEYLGAVGIDLVLCEIEAESRTVVEQVAAESLDEQLAHLEQEVAEFDGTQKPSTYSRRLDEYQRLRQRAGLYKDALGLGVEKAEKVLGELEQKVQTMLDIRLKTVVHRDGTVDRPSGPASNASEPPPPAAIKSLRFAGAVFNAAPSDDPAVHVFVSDDQSAIAAARALESMGLNRWQDAGPAQFCVRNSGPPGAAVSVSIKPLKGQPLQSAAKALAALGIELAYQRR